MSQPVISPSFCSLSSTKTDITQTMMDAGFQINQILTAQELNSYLRMALSTSPQYSSIQNAYNYGDVGSVSQVFEDDTTNAPGHFNITVYQSGLVFDFLVATSTVLLGCEETDTAVLVLDREDPDTVVHTLTLTNSGNIAALEVFGNYAAVAYGNYVEVFSIVTGASLWVYNHGGTVNAVTMNGPFLVLGGVAGSGGAKLRILYLTSGVLIDSYSAVPTVYAIGMYGNMIYVGTDFSVFNLAAIGIDYTGAFNASPLWTTAVGAADIGLLKTDGYRTYVSEVIGSDLYCINNTDGSTINTIGFGIAIDSMAIDQGGIYIHCTDPSSPLLYRITLQDLSLVWKANVITQSAAITCDGCRVWVGGRGGGNGILRYYRGNCPQRFLKVDGDAFQYRRYPWLMIPATE